MEKVDGDAASQETLVINVGGVRFYVKKSDVTRHGVGLLADADALGRYHRDGLGEYFFNRNPRAFSPIGAYYKTGRLYLPEDVCGAEFRNELRFWGINPALLADRCWVRYQRALAAEDGSGQGSGQVDKEFQSSSAIWKILNNVHPSCLSVFYPLVSSLVIIVLLTVMAVQTLPEFKHYRIVNDTTSDLSKIEEIDEPWDSTAIIYTTILLLCLGFFIVELILYLVFYIRDVRVNQNKPLSLRTFLKPILIFDVLTILSLFLFLFPLFAYVIDPDIAKQLAADFASMRAFRVLWFLRFWNPGRGLTYVIRHKFRSLLFLGFTMVTMATIFGIWVYVLESDSEDSHFRDFFSAYYYSWITMTTVGYGDYRPIGMYAKIFAVFICMSGVVFYGLFAVVCLTGYMEYFSTGRFRKAAGDGATAAAGQEQGQEFTRGSAPEGEGAKNGKAEESMPLKQHNDCSANAVDTVTLVVEFMTLEVTRASLGDLDLDRYPKDKRGFHLVDGNRESVEAIINYFRTGRLYVPKSVDGEEFTEELGKWNLTPDVISDSCWNDYKRATSGSDDTSDVINDANVSDDAGWKAEVWNVLENNSNRWYSKVYVFVSTVLTFVLLGTTPPMGTIINVLVVVLICLIFFILEFILRFVFCPNKRRFLFSPVNITDPLAILGTLLNYSFHPEIRRSLLLALTLRSLRGFHLCHFLRHCRVAKGLWYTLTSGLKDFLYIFLLYMSFTFVYSTFVYYAELGHDHSQFRSIPGALWWAFATITTVGYGDITPVGPFGKIFALELSLVGVFLYSVIACVFMQRFEEYKEAQFRRTEKSCCPCQVRLRRSNTPVPV